MFEIKCTECSYESTLMHLVPPKGVGTKYSFHNYSGAIGVCGQCWRVYDEMEKLKW